MIGRLLKILLCIVIALPIMFQTKSVSAISSDENQAVLLVVPGLTWEMITPHATPNLYQMMEAGGVANMVLPLRGDDETRYQGLGVRSDLSLESGVLVDTVRESGGRVATINQNVNVNVDVLMKEYQSARNQANLLVIEFTDIAEMAKQRKEIKLEKLKNEYRNKLSQVDRFMEKLLQDMDENHLLMVVNPISFANIGIGHKSAGVALMAGGMVDLNSLLTSNSTRQMGLISLHDIAPTVLAHFGLSPMIKRGIGQVVEFGTFKESSFQYVKYQMENFTKLNQYRPFLLKGYVGIMIGMLLLTFAFVCLKLRKPLWMDTLLTGLLLFPVLYLIQPVFGFPPPGEMVITILLLFGLGWLGLSFLKTARTRLQVISVITILLLFIDMLQQGSWMKLSVMGYDVLGGARYYGIGNEYMGILLGAILLLYYLQQDQKTRISRMASRVSFPLITYLLAAPQFGSNAGGALAAIITFTFVVLSEIDRPVFRKKWIWVVGGTGLGLVVIILVNLHVPETQYTHIGRMVSQLLQGEFSEAWQMIWRKWKLNWWLLYVSIWGKLFILTLAILGLRWLRPDYFQAGKGGSSLKETSSMALSFLVAGISAFLLNDSGIMAAAGLMMFASVALLINSNSSQILYPKTDVEEDIMIKGRSGE